jgi:hypothetical protein
LDREEVLEGEAVLTVEPIVEVMEAVDEVRELPPKPLTVVELELLDVVGTVLAAVDVGVDESTGGTETG